MCEKKRTEDGLLPWLEHVESCGDLVAVVELLEIAAESHGCCWMSFYDDE